MMEEFIDRREKRQIELTQKPNVGAKRKNPKRDAYSQGRAEPSGRHDKWHAEAQTELQEMQDKMWILLIMMLRIASWSISGLVSTLEFVAYTFRAVTKIRLTIVDYTAPNN